MTTIAFDTYKAVKALKQAGFEEGPGRSRGCHSRRRYGRKCSDESGYC